MINVHCIISREIVLVFDEMKIHEDLVFDVQSGNIIGYVDTGDINSKLKHFEAHVTGKTHDNEVATHMLALYVRGIFTNLGRLGPVMWQSWAQPAHAQPYGGCACAIAAPDRLPFGLVLKGLSHLAQTSELPSTATYLSLPSHLLSTSSSRVTLLFHQWAEVQQSLYLLILVGLMKVLVFHFLLHMQLAPFFVPQLIAPYGEMSSI